MNSYRRKDNEELSVIREIVIASVEQVHQLERGAVDCVLNENNTKWNSN